MLKYLKNLFKGTEGIDTTHRVYEFKLPYTMTAVILHYGLGQLKSEGIFQKLPKDMQDKMTKAKAAWHSIKITKADLDRIDDDTWAKIATKLKLKWKKKTLPEGMYEVGKKDTVFSMAKKFKVTVGVLIDWNPEIEDPNKIYAGQWIWKQPPTEG